MISHTEYGCLMKIKHGTKGDTPLKDVFSFFSPEKKQWVIIVWDVDPSNWKLVYFENNPMESNRYVLSFYLWP